MYHEAFKAYVADEAMPCVFGKRVVERGTYTYLAVEGKMSDKEVVGQVCEGLYRFTHEYGVASIGQAGRLSPDNFASFDVAFVDAIFDNQVEAARELYTLLVHMHQYDHAQGYPWAEGVSNDPHSPDFQMSIGGQAWFLPLLWSGAYAPSRRSPHVYLPWQSNNLFKALRAAGKYQAAQDLVRNEELRVHGFVPELLGQLGDNVEILSYLLPHKNDAQIVWDALQLAGGEYPFGRPLTSRG